MTSPTAPTASLRPAALVSPYPLRPLPEALPARLEARRRAGYEPVGADHPRRERWQTLVLPGLLLGPVAAVACIVGLALGRGLLAEIAGGVLAAAALAAAVGARWVRADPLRIRRGEQRLLDAAGHWESQQPWTPALTTGPERALLGEAVEVVGRIASDAAWRSDHLALHRQELDLAAELDQIDQQALTVAAARVAGGPAGEVQGALEVALARVASLRGYEAGVGELAARLADADDELAVVPVMGELRAGSDQSTYAVEVVARLTEEVGFITASFDRVVPRELS